MRSPWRAVVVAVMTTALGFCIALSAAVAGAAPKATAPEATAPEAKAAETSAAETSAAETSAPETSAAETSAPETSPGATAPRPPTPARTVSGDPIAVQAYTLQNGLTVWLSENHERAEVFGAVVVRAGGKNDPPDATGIAHYLEHMLFKGTEQIGTVDFAAEGPLLAELDRLYDELAVASDAEARARIRKRIIEVSARAAKFAVPNEFDRMLAELGSQGVNAFTTEDITVYYNRFPQSEIKGWLELYAHRFERPVFRLFAAELETVYEEKNRSIDGLFDPAYEKFMRRFFPTHPYGTQRVLGSIEHLKRPSLSKMREFYERHYVPGNMALVLAGDFDSGAIIETIETHFGRWAAKPVPTPPAPAVPPLRGRSVHTLRFTPIRAAGLGFRLPGTGHQDAPELEVVQELLSNEQGSGYIDAISNEGDVLYAQSIPMPLHEHGGIVVFFIPRLLSQSFRAAERVVLRQFYKIARGQFTADRVRAVRDNLARTIRTRWEDNEQRVLTMVEVFGRRQSWADYIASIRRLERLTKADVVRVAAKYFADDYLVMRSRVGYPKKQRLKKPGYPPVKPTPGAHSDYYRDKRPLPPPRSKPRLVDFDGDIARRDLAPRVHLAANQNPFNDLFRLELRFGVGRYQKRPLWLLGDYLGRIGTGRASPQALRERWYALATTFSAFATDDEFVVRVEGPQRNFSKVLGLLREVLTDARADRKQLRKLRREESTRQRILRREPRTVADALWGYVVHGKQSEYRQRYGPLGLQSLYAGELMDAWREVQGFETTVRYVGPRSLDQVAEVVAKVLPIRTDLRPAVGRFEPRRQIPATDSVYFVPRRRAVQSHMYLALEGSVTAGRDAALAEAYNEYFDGGMAGLVFQEIREFRALAYAASGGYLRARVQGRPGYLYGYVATQGDKTIEATDLMRRLVRNLPRKTERIAGLRSALARGQELDDPGFRDLQGMVQTWRDRGYRRDPRAEFGPVFARLKFDEIEDFHHRYVEGRPMTVMVVGDPRRVKKRDLKRFGRLRTIAAHRLFAP